MTSTPSSGSGGATDAQESAQKDVLQFLKGKKGDRLEGFDLYGGDLISPFSQQEGDILGNFLGSDLDLVRNALSDIYEQDAIGRAQMLLEPSMNRSIETGINQVRERYGVTGNLASASRGLAEGRVVGDTTSANQATLAQMLPQLMGLRIGAAQALPQVTGQAMGLAAIPRLIQQQGLDAQYQEYLRTTPSGGPLQSLLGLAGGTPGGGQQLYGQSGLAQMLQLAAMFGGSYTGSNTGG
jgi:hypothetical protein